MTPLRLRGAARVPGDKSIAHRALVVAAMAGSASTLNGVPDGLDVLATRACLESVGVTFEGSSRSVRVVPPRTWLPGTTLDARNSGTTARLLAGALAAQRCPGTIVGDASLSSRPMERVAAPLRALGAAVTTDEGRLPMTVRGTNLAATRWEQQVPSAQVKSAFLLAALGAGGESTYVEPAPTRDHLERMLPPFGVPVEVDGDAMRVRGGRPHGARLSIPGDPSSAAVVAIAAAVLPGSDVVIEGVLLNPLRTAFLEVLVRMGALVVVEPDEGAPTIEPSGSVRIAAADALKAVTVAARDVPRLVDEIPLLAVAAACATGESRFEGLAELRVKESDRLGGTVDLLESAGVDVALDGDALVVRGGSDLAYGPFDARGDHRLVMARAVLALRMGRRPEPDEVVAVSWPAFFDRLGALVVA